MGWSRSSCVDCGWSGNCGRIHTALQLIRPQACMLASLLKRYGFRSEECSKFKDKVLLVMTFVDFKKASTASIE